MPTPLLADLSHKAAIRALDLQERGVEQLRARTGTLLAASSLTASFLGAQAIRRADGIGTPSVLALIALASSIVLCIYVLAAEERLRFRDQPVEDVRVIARGRTGRDGGAPRLAYRLEAFWRANQAQIDTLGRYFLVAASALILQLAFWSWALAASIS